MRETKIFSNFPLFYPLCILYSLTFPSFQSNKPLDIGSVVNIFFFFGSTCWLEIKIEAFSLCWFFFLYLDVPWDFLLTSSLLLIVFVIHYVFLVFWALASSFRSTFLAWRLYLFGDFTFYWTQRSYSDVYLHIIKLLPYLHIIKLLPCNNNLLAISILDVLITAVI